MLDKIKTVFKGIVAFMRAIKDKWNLVKAIWTTISMRKIYPKVKNGEIETEEGRAYYQRWKDAMWVLGNNGSVYEKLMKIGLVPYNERYINYKAKQKQWLIEHLATYRLTLDDLEWGKK